MVGYATAYTMAPVFSLVLDRDVNEDLALLYPELYKDLTKVCIVVLSVSAQILSLSTGSCAIVQDILYVVND
jgi:hypothetical protein